MFFLTYLRRELRRRMRQAIVIALGLALGIGLVITVSAAAEGVSNAQSGVLKGLYGVGTDITVTGQARAVQPRPRRDPHPDRAGRRPSLPRQRVQARRPDRRQPDQPGLRPAGRLDGRLGRAAARRGQRGRRPHAHRHADQDPGLDRLRRPRHAAAAQVVRRGRRGPVPARARPAQRRRRSPTAGTWPAPTPTRTSRWWTPTTPPRTSSRSARRSRIAKKEFTVIGIVRQPQGGSPPDVYIPLAPGPGPGPAASAARDLKTRSTPSTWPRPAPPTSPPCRRRSPGCCPRPP